MNEWKNNWKNDGRMLWKLTHFLLPMIAHRWWLVRGCCRSPHRFQLLLADDRRLALLVPSVSSPTNRYPSGRSLSLQDPEAFRPGVWLGRYPSGQSLSLQHPAAVRSGVRQGAPRINLKYEPAQISASTLIFFKIRMRYRSDWFFETIE